MGESRLLLQCLLQIDPKRKLKMLVSKSNILFQGAIFRFYVGFRGCILWTYRQVALSSLFEWVLWPLISCPPNPAWQAPYNPPSFLSSRMHDWLNHYKGITAPGKARPIFLGGDDLTIQQPCWGNHGGSHCLSRWWFHFFSFSPRNLGKMNPFWRAYLFRWVGSTTN